MIKMIKLWLRKNELDNDTHYYTIDEWRNRKEEYHNDSEFVIVTEGGLNSLINYGDSSEFYDLVSSLGYYYELGHSWNLGFYKRDFDDKVPNVISQRSYTEKLKDYRWKQKRKYILERADNKCEDCSSTQNLEIHHCYYMYGYEPWEYPYDSLRCLCKICHEERGLTEQILRGHLASIKTNELKSIIKLISSGLYWYPRDEVFSLLSSFNHDQKEMQTIFSNILAKRIKH